MIEIGGRDMVLEMWGPLMDKTITGSCWMAQREACAR